jgi:hypothetical protein
MATLANVFGRIAANGSERTTAAPRRMDHSARLRPFPSEDILFYSKRIDNSRVVRQSDPVERGRCWKLIGSMVGAAVLLIGVLLPSSYGLLAGFQIQKLHNESRLLDAEQSALELQEAQLLSPARMQELAVAQQFVDPAPQKVVYLDGQQGSLAMNQK